VATLLADSPPAPSDEQSTPDAPASAQPAAPTVVSVQLSDFRYSPAMKRSGIVWTVETLDRYIADPQGVIPANRMPYAGMTNAADRADLIAYLKNAAK